MDQKTTPNNLPTRGIWKRFLVLLPLIVVMAVASLAYVRSVGSTMKVWTPPFAFETDGSMPTYDGYGVDDVIFDVPGVVEAVSVEHSPDGSAAVTFKAIADGETDVTFGDEMLETFWSLRVSRGVIVEGNVDFSGWESVHICVCIFFAVTVALFASALMQLVRRAWYGYEMVACGGGLVFCLFQLAFFVFLLLRGSLRSFADMALELSNMADYFIVVTLVPLGVLAVLVSLSNISLIRHEGRRPVNLLGIALSLVWLAIIVFWRQWAYLGIAMGLSFQMLGFLDSAMSIAIAYGEILLFSTIVCGWLASRHVPSHAVDYLVVLGCGIRKDGTPSPLLAGRVDRAYDFDSARVAMGDAPTTFVPSGGQGPDEVMSEAQSMQDYLMGKGVDAQRIVLEDRSTTTKENMAFSREVIEAHAGCDVSEVSVGFSTTNYHVFRGYVCAHEAGMAIEGMGSKTKAYFWPNAFLREFAGLLVTQWKGILQMYLVIAVLYLFAEYVLIMR